MRRLGLCLLVLVPTGLVGTFAPSLTLMIIQGLTGWAEVVFNGLLPLWLIIVVRFGMQISKEPLLFGGKALITILFMASLFFLYIQGVSLFYRP